MDGIQTHKQHLMEKVFKSKACKFRMRWQLSNFSVVADGKTIEIKHLACTGLL
jgi:hypothetical protein